MGGWVCVSVSVCNCVCVCLSICNCFCVCVSAYICVCNCFLLVQVCESSRMARWPSGWVGGLLPPGANCECLTGRIPETG